MKQKVLFLLLSLFVLSACSDGEDVSSVRSSFAINGTVTNMQGVPLSGIELQLALDSVPLDTTYSTELGTYAFSGDAKGESILWIYAEDLNQEGTIYQPDTVKVVLFYRGGNGRANLGHGTASVAIQLDTIR